MGIEIFLETNSINDVIIISFKIYIMSIIEPKKNIRSRYNQPSKLEKKKTRKRIPQNKKSEELDPHLQIQFSVIWKQPCFVVLYPFAKDIQCNPDIRELSGLEKKSLISGIGLIYIHSHRL